MSRNPREYSEEKGFWDGGPQGHGSDDQSGGRRSGVPGSKAKDKFGVSVDLDVPSKKDRDERNRTEQSDTDETDRPDR